MSKVLSVCVPSYNMEKYLNRCIDSMLVPEVLDQLEIIIVNDGSTDSTLSIANEYKTKYSQSVVVVDKPNGHYGSCINASLKVATGKYFRIVDADDWVDSEALSLLVHRLMEIDVDCVSTKYTTVSDESSWTNQLDVPFDEVLDLNQYMVPVSCQHMHGLIYSTDLLRRIGYVQTEGICYTDVEYAYYPLACAKNIYFMDISLYQYYYGRDGQSMEWNGLVKNNDHYVKLIKSLMEMHQSDKSVFNSSEQRLFSRCIQDTLLSYALPIYILYYKYDKEKEQLFREAMSLLKKEGSFEYPGMLGVNKIRMINLWYNTGELSRCLMFPFRWYEKIRSN